MAKAQSGTALEHLVLDLWRTKAAHLSEMFAFVAHGARRLPMCLMLV
eukprot:CAMPEP_0203953260 /NCGR_PEP_ID=MMETSP0359-20131031/86674_1 /ASSEMBLY_ACC=CAM_ASM_000338 /TAXON_ID=268821 /ORGANISM="Scrippsiella Hangoei, Strain SHTV-5" /LENGTH=46 /DNA_ID= /DNA_START= /DNA_END= /DNA_ORIENTATION=